MMHCEENRGDLPHEVLYADLRLQGGKILWRRTISIQVWPPEMKLF